MLDPLRLAIRSLRRSPSLALISIITVALGVGAGTSLFSVVKAVLLDPLPYPQPSRLAWIAEMDDSGHELQVALATFEDWQKENRSFAALASFGEGPVNAGGGDIPERTHGAEVSQDFFDVIGIHPVMGRVFTPEEQQFNTAGTVILGDGLWRRAYGADLHILGRTIKLMGQPFKVIGVMPAGFDYPNKSELWIPSGAFFKAGDRTAHNFHAIGRLKPGVRLELAREDVGAISRRLKQQFPSPFMAKDAAVVSLERHIIGEVRQPLLMLFGAVGFLLLIVCVNAANLLTVRVATRAREISVRVALGAGRRHLIRQLLTESVTLALAGGAAGLMVALWSMDLLRILLPQNLPRMDGIRIDAGVVAFAILLSAATGILFGVLPAWRASRLNINEALKAGSRSYTAGRRANRTQAALVVSEVCLSLVLVAGAGLLLNSFSHLRAVNPGFDTDHLLIASVSFELPPSGFQRVSPMLAELNDSLRTIPGVQSAGIAKDIPLDSEMHTGHFNIEHHPERSGAVQAGYRIISPGYLKALHIPIRAGRDLEDNDTRSSQPVAVISAEMARKYWPDENPLGRRIWFDSFSRMVQWVTVVGIAGDVRQNGLTEPVEVLAYVPHTQVNPVMLLDENLVLRTTSDPNSIVSAVRDRLRKADPEVVMKFQTMDQVLAGSVARQRFQMQVLVGFAVLALVLAAVGLYGVLSYIVTSQRTEIGIRMALGAQPGTVFRMITARALRMAGIGAAIGLAACLAMRSLLANLLYGVGPSDPMTLAIATSVLIAVALIASWFPARKAMRVDPVSILRED
jgi:predicted permease